ncbi:phosphonate metabolism protein PhnP [Yersinia entomophaga]
MENKMQLTLLGTGGAQQVPAFGCDCPACQRACQQPRFRRGPCSAMLRYQGESHFIDAGLPTLGERFSADEIQRFWLTHYHMDHVQGLFPLRWGYSSPIPVYGPPDADGCDDLFKHSGILDFQPPLTPFQPLDIAGLQITPLPLNHSKPTFGYLYQSPRRTLAYLTDTAGLPESTTAFLARLPLDLLVMDCSHPPQTNAPRNHNDVSMALEIHRQLRPVNTLLTHVSHQLDCWLMNNLLPAGVAAAYDNQVIIL